MATGKEPKGPLPDYALTVLLRVSFTMFHNPRPPGMNMARPCVPHHLKPVPTTISLAVHHRRWMDEGGLSPSAVVNRLLDRHRADQERNAEQRHAVDTAERAIAHLKALDEEAENLAFSFVAQHAPASRLAAMLLKRVQDGERLGPTGPILAHALADLTDERTLQAAIEATVYPERVFRSCAAVTKAGHPCTKPASTLDGEPDHLCAIHRRSGYVYGGEQ